MEGEYTHVLIPVDGSDVSLRAAEHGIAIAQRFGARVTVFHVVDEDLLPIDGRSKLLVEGLEAEAEEIVAEVLDHALEVGIAAESEIGHGSPAQEILATIEDTGADLVVLGSHGRSGLDKLLIGSVSERVIHRSPIPVLTVRK
ncbi:universal stress protein [Haloarchaeobius sp. DFWS5]|uniref:universal stress protein n=1 Tax=Haloarchaeobius sp. DFWS5 TaxID=3446114 RepID=UPI003EC00CD7